MCGAMAYVLIRKGGGGRGGYVWSNGICTDQKRRGGGAMCEAMAYVLIRAKQWHHEKRRGGGYV